MTEYKIVVSHIVELCRRNLYIIDAETKEDAEDLALEQAEGDGLSWVEVDSEADPDGPGIARPYNGQVP